MPSYVRIGTFCQNNFGEITYESKIFKFSDESHFESIVAEGLEGLIPDFEKDLPDGWCIVDMLESIEKMDSISETDKYITVPEQK